MIPLNPSTPIAVLEAAARSMKTEHILSPDTENALRLR